MDKLWMSHHIINLMLAFSLVSLGSPFAGATELKNQPSVQEAEAEFQAVESQDPQMQTDAEEKASSVGGASVSKESPASSKSKAANPPTGEGQGSDRQGSVSQGNTRKTDDIKAAEGNTDEFQMDESKTKNNREGVKTKKGFRWSESEENGLPSWSAADPRKGFESADEDGTYYYDEDAPSLEKYYEDDIKVTPHPRNKANGLLSVTSDGSYLYENEESEREGGVSLRVARMESLAIERQIGPVTIDFQEMYGDKPFPLVFLDYDLFQGRRFGHWVISVGLGYAQATGAGYFKSDGSRAQEKYTFHFIMAQLGGVYRFQYTPHPWLVPYIGVGTAPVTLFESRDDNKRQHYKTIAASHASGGLRLNLGNFDTHGAGMMDAEYGINNFWLDFEYRRLQALDTSVDVSSNFMNVGLGFDF